MYEIFEHTADFGIRARAASLDHLFAEAARGLFSLMVANLDSVQPTQQVELQLAADDQEALLHDWLSELLYIFHARRLVFREFAVQVGSSRLKAVARGEPIDLDRHEIDMEVKAITGHALKIEQQSDGWLAEVIVDV